MQLVTGNSLIGARSQVFDTSILGKNGKKSWLDSVPERVKLSEKRPDDSVYHFLVPDNGMAKYTDKVIKELEKDNITLINEWRKDFTKPFSQNEIDQLIRLTDAVDRLWQSHIQDRKHVWERTHEKLPVFGQDFKTKGKDLTTQDKDKIYYQEIISENVRSSSPYRRLKLVMDYWCALWFWPIDKADMLPSRDEYLMELSLILEGDVYDPVPAGETRPLFPNTITEDEYQTHLDLYGFVDVDKLIDELPRLALVKKTSISHRFHYWELVFAVLFKQIDGFDLIVGNPPWIKIV